MKQTNQPYRNGTQRGFSLVEMMVSMAVLLIVIGGVLQLLNQSQQRYVSTSNAEDSTAMTREALDLMTREIRLAGYPPPSSYPPGPPPVIQPGVNEQYVAANFVGGVLTGGGFLVGNPYAIQFEADVGIPAGCGQLPIPPGLYLTDQRCTSNTGVVSVIDYQVQVPPSAAGGGCAGLTVNGALTSPTLMRSQVPKNANGAAVVPVFVPFVSNVLNCRLSLPMFTYCPAPAPPGAPPVVVPAGCPNMAAMKSSTLPAPRNTRIVMIRLQAQTQFRDPQNGQFQIVELFNLAQRVNPD